MPLAIYLLLTLHAEAAVYEKDKTFLPKNFPVQFCWWAGSYAPKSELKKKIEKHVLDNLGAIDSIQINRDWPACEAQPADKVSEFVGILPFDEVEANPKANKQILQKLEYFEYNTFDHPKTPGHPRAEHFGRYQDLGKFDVVLSFHFKKVMPSLMKQAKGLSTQGKENLILSIALHEILHVFGALHEHLHMHSDCIQKGEEPLPRGKNPEFYGSMLISPRFDRASIMNYCVTRTHNYEVGPLQMSQGDREFLNEVYSSR